MGTRGFAEQCNYAPWRETIGLVARPYWSFRSTSESAEEKDFITSFNVVGDLDSRCVPVDGIMHDMYTIPKNYSTDTKGGHAVVE
jgi:hypothetical protein